MVKWLKLLMLIAKTKCGEELADVAIYLLGLAEILSIDLDGEIQKKWKSTKPATISSYGNGYAKRIDEWWFVIRLNWQWIVKGSGKRNDNQLKHAWANRKRFKGSCWNVYCSLFKAEPWNDQLTVPQITEYVSSMMAMNTYIGYFLTDSLTNEKIGYSLGFIKPWYQGKEYVIDTFLIAGKHQGKGFGSAF